MNIQHRQTQFYSLLAVALTLFLLFTPFPKNHTTTGIVKPLSEYSLISTGTGSFSTVLVDHWTDQQISRQSISSQRGGLMSFSTQKNISRSREIAIGDTLGTIYSSEVEAEIARLQGNIATLNASLALERSGSRQSVINGARLRLAYAKTRYEERKKILQRSADLLSRNIISQQEYDDDESQERLDSIRISIAEADLASALSGAQTAKLEVIKTQIAEEENKLELQLELYNALTLTSPISGRIDFPMSDDILWSVQKTDTLLVWIPVYSKDVTFSAFTGDLIVRAPGFERIIPGDEIQVSQKLYSLGSDQMVLLKARFPQGDPPLQLGERLDIVIKQGSKSVFSHILGLF
jgi:hypothetical protein